MTDHTCHTHAHPHAHAHWLPRMDALGSLAAFVCAVHCAFLPMMAVLMPLTTVTLFGGHEVERGFVSFALLFGGLVLSAGLSRASRVPVALLFLSALVFLTLGVWTHAMPILHALLMVIGGVSLGSAHALNRHSARTHQDAQALWRNPRTMPQAPPIAPATID